MAATPTTPTTAAETQNSPSGYDVSRGNALKHGLSGAGTVMPEELAAAVTRLEAALRRDLQCRDDYEGQLIRNMALGSARMRTAFELICALEADNCRRDLLSWDEDHRKMAEQVASKLDANPPMTVLELRRSTKGNEWLIAAWAGLVGAIHDDRCDWTEAEFGRALNLLGVALEWRHVNRVAREWREAWEAARTDPPDQPAGRRALRARIDAVVADLNETADRMFEIDKRMIESLARGHRVDVSPPVRKLHRLMNDATRMQERALRRLEAYRAGKPDPTLRPPTPPKPRPEPSIPDHDRASLERARRRPTMPAPPTPREWTRGRPPSLETTVMRAEIEALLAACAPSDADDPEPLAPPMPRPMQSARPPSSG